MGQNTEWITCELCGDPINPAYDAHLEVWDIRYHGPFHYCCAAHAVAHLDTLPPAWPKQIRYMPKETADAIRAERGEVFSESGHDLTYPPPDAVINPIVWQDIVGHCPHCGAPIYGRKHVVEEPKIRFTCQCRMVVGPMETK